VLHIYDVLNQETPAKAEAAAAQSTRNLSLTYEKMLSRIRPQGIKLLHWVLFATRLLTVEELRFAIAIEEGMVDLNPIRQLPFSSFLDSALGLLAVDSVEQTVRFAHATVKDYLAEHTSRYFSDGHSLLARKCLTFLNFQALSSESGRARLRSGGNLSPFFEYAAFQWGHHAREAGDDRETLNMAVRWLLSERMRQVHSVRNKYKGYHWLSYVPDPPSPLCEACYFGLHSHVGKLLEFGQGINTLDSNGIGPLYSAVWHNRLAVVQLLFQYRNLDVNVQTTDLVTPLHAASWLGHTDIVRLFLTMHSNRFPFFLRSFLRSFLPSSWMRVVEVNAQDKHGWTALSSAAKHGFDDIVDLLLQHPDTNINVRDMHGWTALTRAVDGGHADTVRRLLRNKNIDVAASRVGEVGFWESIPPSVFAQGKHMSLPYDLHLQLGLPEMANRK
jgi:ankyrin repeat protein